MFLDVNSISRSALRNIYKITPGIALAYTLLLTPVYSQQIVVDGYTNTSLQTNGNLTKVTTSTAKGNNAFNSFSKFNVDSGKTVNLIFPGETQNLINIIKSEQSTIDGTLNAIQNNHIGGNMFLVNPYGVIIGTEGVVNTGSLTITTPTSDFVNTFFSSPGDVNDASVDMLLNESMPISKDSVINVNGKINAITDVHLSSNKVETNGLITTNAIFNEQNIDIGDVVNVNTLEYLDNDLSKLVLNNGTISIKATSTVSTGGSLYAGEDLSIDISSEDSSAYMTLSNTTARANNINLNATAGTYENKTLLDVESLSLNAVIKINSSSLTALNDFTLTTTGGQISNVNIEPESYFSASVGSASSIIFSSLNIGNNLNIINTGGSINNLNVTNSNSYSLFASSQFSSYGTGSSFIVGKTATIECSGGIISGTKTMNDNSITEDAYAVIYFPTIVTGEDLIVKNRGGQVTGLEDHQQSTANVYSMINFVSTPISVNGDILIENIAGGAKYVSQVNADARLETIETMGGDITSQQKIVILNQVNPGAIIAQSGQAYSNITLSELNLSSKKGIDIYAQIIDPPTVGSLIDSSAKIQFSSSANISSQGNINLTTPGTITINGTLSLKDDSGISKDLLINEDNTIDPSSTIGAILENNLFIVEDTYLLNSNDYNMSINLNGELDGTGKIITSSGPLSINIINNSDNDILINNLKAVVNSYGNIFLNGKSINTSSVSPTIQYNYSSPSINITSKQDTSIILNGNIESITDLNQNEFLIINADGSIDKTNTIKTQLDNNMITVSDINIKGLSSYINISGNLQGIGNLKSYAIIPEVKIINNSQYDLNLQNVQISNLGQPHIVLNNEELDYNIGNISITKTYSGGTGNIVINNTTNTDILLSGNISNPSYDVYLTNKHGNILLYGPYIITAKNIFLTATEGSIGNPNAYINIDENDLSGAITARSAGNICLREISGDMRIATLNSQNADIYLSVRDGGVISASSSNVENISGRNLYIGNPKNYYFLGIYGTLYRPKDFLGFLFDTLKASGNNWENIDKSKYTFLDTNNITKEEVISYFEQYSKVMTDEDVFVICYMGHGGGGGDPYSPYSNNHDIGTDNTPIDEDNGIALDIGDEYFYFEHGFTITDDEFAQSLKNTRGTIVFLSDQCHGGGMLGGDADLNAIADQNGFNYFSIAGNREGLFTYIDTYVASDGHKYMLVGDNYIMLIRSLLGTDLQYSTYDYNLNPIVINMDPAINSDGNVYLNEWYSNTFKQVMYNDDAEPNYPIDFLRFSNMSNPDFKNNPLIYGNGWDPLSLGSPVALVGTKDNPLMLNITEDAHIFARDDINLSGKIAGNRIFISQNGSINLSGNLADSTNINTTGDGSIYINNNNTQYLFSRNIDIFRNYYEDLQKIFSILGEDFTTQNIFVIPEEDFIFSSNNNDVNYMGYELGNINDFLELQNNEYGIMILQDAMEVYKKALENNASKSSALKQATEYILKQNITSGTLENLLQSKFAQQNSLYNALLQNLILTRFVYFWKNVIYQGK